MVLRVALYLQSLQEGTVFRTWLLAYSAFGRQIRPEMSLYEYKMILVSIKLPEEIPWYRASRRGMVVMSAGCWKQTLFVVCRVYITGAPKNAAMTERLQEMLGPRQHRDHHLHSVWTTCSGLDL